MPAVTGHIGVLKSSEVLINGTDYANQLTRARLVPETPSQSLRTLVPDGTITDTDSASWTFEIAGIQKHATGGLAALLNAAEAGEILEVEWEPRKGVVGQPHYVFEVVAKAVPIGGDQGAFGTFEVTLDVVGAPVQTAISS